MMTITIEFHGDLISLVRRRWQGCREHTLASKRTASIKDVVEAFGLPHTEVGSLLVDGGEVDFTHLVGQACRIDVLPITAPWDPLQPSLLRPIALAELRFLVDINVSKLGRLLRMVGLDAASHPTYHDPDLADCAANERRILLSKDRGLLMRKKVEFGRYVRASYPDQQLEEILNLFALHDQLTPLVRCMECNSLLEEVAKEEILHLLEPLTRKYYHEFSRCPGCGKIYWPGSHYDRMQALLESKNA